MKDKKIRKIFGDFQTPIALAEEMCGIIEGLNIKPSVIIEPTCGKGNILLTAMNHFPEATRGIGLEINKDYINMIKSSNVFQLLENKIDLFHADFFNFNLSQLDILKSNNELLIIGNPPWVTNSELGHLGSDNLPKKSNSNGEKGIAAITGKSNFDISEFILLEFLKKYSNIKYSLAILCKTSVARKILLYAWKNNLEISNEKIFLIDAMLHFNASVDSCMLFFQNGRSYTDNRCKIYKEINFKSEIGAIGYSNNHLISNIELYDKSKHIEGKSQYVWRNGIKHDAAKVMEFSFVDDKLINGLNKEIDIELDLVFPLLKSSDIANGKNGKTIVPRKFVLVPQHFIGEDTDYIHFQFPKTWSYLENYQDIFYARKSSIYKNKPKYSIFSVGEYTFAPYKIAISGLYKTLSFKLISKYNSKPYILDDTCNFIPAYSREEAELLLELITSEIATDFLKSMIFWDAKRPITTEILNKLNIYAIARELNLLEKLHRVSVDNKFVKKKYDAQLSLF